MTAPSRVLRNKQDCSERNETIANYTTSKSAYLSWVRWATKIQHFTSHHSSTSSLHINILHINVSDILLNEHHIIWISIKVLTYPANRWSLVMTRPKVELRTLKYCLTKVQNITKKSYSRNICRKMDTGIGIAHRCLTFRKIPHFDNSNISQLRNFLLRKCFDKHI